MKKSTVSGMRSVFDLGDYNDDEVYDLELEPSLTDPSQDETIESLVARMVRGELVGKGAPIYDEPEAAAAGSVPVTERDGFDLADAPVILDAAKAASDALKAPVLEPVAPVVAEPVVQPPN